MSFSETYIEARRKFRRAAEQAGARLEALKVLDHPEYGELTIDAALFGESSEKGLIITSGIHGVEGFAGSAIQTALMDNGVPEDIRVILIHALNPYGMACIRRVNENNVDLNRNFFPDGAAYSGASEGYQALYSVLHPQTPHGGFDPFLPRAVVKILQHGMPKLKQAVAGGQYDFPKGLFWGGAQLEQTPRLLGESIPGWVRGLERQVVIDIHTGLGKSGDYVLLVHEDSGSDELDRYLEGYGQKVQALDPTGSVAYGMSGTFPEDVKRHFQGWTDVLTLEFGTCAPLKVIQALRAENRAHFWGGDVKDAKRRLRDAFYPQSDRWKNAVLNGGAGVLEQALYRLRGTSWP